MKPAWRLVVTSGVVNGTGAVIWLLVLGLMWRTRLDCLKLYSTLLLLANISILVCVQLTYFELEWWTEHHVFRKTMNYWSTACYYLYAILFNFTLWLVCSNYNLLSWKLHLEANDLPTD